MNEEDPPRLVQLPDHVYAQIKWLLVNPPNVAAVAALADELAEWVATHDTPPLDPLLESLPGGMRYRITTALAGRGIADFNALLKLKGRELRSLIGIGPAAFRCVALAVADMGIVPPDSWVEELGNIAFEPGYWRHEVTMRVRRCQHRANARVAGIVGTPGVPPPAGAR